MNGKEKVNANDIKSIIRSLISHPSLVKWNGCNGCERNINVTRDIHSDFVTHFDNIDLITMLENAERKPLTAPAKSTHPKI